MDIWLLYRVVGLVVRVLNPAYPEGWMLAILFMNSFAPLIDYFIVQSNIKKKEQAVFSNKYILMYTLVMALISSVSLAFVVNGLKPMHDQNEAVLKRKKFSIPSKIRLV